MMLFVSTPLDTQPVHFWQRCIFYRIFCINHRPTLDLCIDIYPPTEQPLRSNHQLSGWTVWCQDLPESLCLLDPSGFLIEYISTSHLEGTFCTTTTKTANNQEPIVKIEHQLEVSSICWISIFQLYTQSKIWIPNWYSNKYENIAAAPFWRLSNLKLDFHVNIEQSKHCSIYSEAESFPV